VPVPVFSLVSLLTHSVSAAWEPSIPTHCRGRRQAYREALALLETLSAILWRNEVEALLHGACLVSDWPDETQRQEAAERLIRAAMYEAALGKISDDVKQQILAILRPFCPDLFYSGLPPEVRPEDWLG